MDEKPDVKTMPWNDLNEERNQEITTFENYKKMWDRGEKVSRKEFDEYLKRCGQVCKEMERRLKKRNLEPIQK